MNRHQNERRYHHRSRWKVSSGSLPQGSERERSISLQRLQGSGFNCAEVGTWRVRANLFERTLEHICRSAIETACLAGSSIWADLKEAQYLMAGELVAAKGHARIFVWFGCCLAARSSSVQPLGEPDH